MNYHPSETETDCRICLCFTCAPETNFPLGLWRVLGQQPQASTLVGPSRQRGVDPHRAGGAERVTLQRRVVSQEVSAHSRTHKEHQTLSGLQAYVASLKKERLTPILGVLYISPSAVIHLEDASYGNKFHYCIPIPLSASAWEMCEVLPS